jgi:hypothetical protein
MKLEHNDVKRVSRAKQPAKQIRSTKEAPQTESFILPFYFLLFQPEADQP